MKTTKQQPSKGEEMALLVSLGDALQSIKYLSNAQQMDWGFRCVLDKLLISVCNLTDFADKYLADQMKQPATLKHFKQLRRVAAGHVQPDRNSAKISVWVIGSYIYNGPSKDLLVESYGSRLGLLNDIIAYYSEFRQALAMLRLTEWTVHPAWTIDANELKEATAKLRQTFSNSGKVTQMALKRHTS
ncbi:hypothetical protein DRH29_00545 [candidate division Kazan bacterium]|uniref:Uncharacterized protein n=1 Tax=candidate division Kazan bacterium TaxID=2202143 RepID=A0A420ZDX7_UNCK3|nr:MAG: hypothetical protein DRH29_00545 [candidate division Kazan bacterium]